ncbi:MAG: redox-regulated ATPase YchF [FCB group bacterium]|nr:redox-regulated ATPase YchF [FCB group bacterium]
MKLGIIGKPQSGKTTVFNAASGHQEAVGDYSQASHRAIIKVPDERVDKLAELVSPKKITYAEIEFLDAPGFTGSGKEAGTLEINPELHHMDALMLVIDAYSPDAHPQKDIQNLIDEMILADQVVVENNIEKKSRKMKLTGDKSAHNELDLLKKCQATLDEGELLINLNLASNEEKMLRGYTFLTQKPLLIAINIDEDKINQQDVIADDFKEHIITSKRDVAVICGKMEMELVTLSPDDRQLFMKELGIKVPAVEKVIQKSYSLLGLISFLTAGEPEVRAWTIKKGDTAQKAAGVIHSDIERGFIRAEVVAYDDYLQYKTMSAIKAAGKARLEGKDYIVKDGLYC